MLFGVDTEALSGTYGFVLKVQTLPGATRHMTKKTKPLTRHIPVTRPMRYECLGLRPQNHKHSENGRLV
jgi:hypothetical protein